MYRTISQQALQHHTKNEPHGSLKSSTVDYLRLIDSRSRPRRDGNDVVTQQKKRGGRLADVVDSRISPARQPRNVLSPLKKRAAGPADVHERRLSRTSLPFAFPTRRQPTSRYRCANEPRGRPTSPTAEQTASSQAADVVDCRLSRTRLLHASLTRRRSEVPTPHSESPTGSSAAKWRTVPETIVGRASPGPADGVGCRMSWTKLQQASLTRRHPTVSLIAARTRPTARRCRGEHGLALNSKFSSSAVLNGRRRAYVDATAATLPAASPKFSNGRLHEGSDVTVYDQVSLKIMSMSRRPSARSLAMTSGSTTVDASSTQAVDRRLA